MGALAGISSHTLVDTAEATVILNVVGNNTSSLYAGVLTGAGSLLKSGSGIMTLSVANTYTGGTTVFGGTRQMGSLSGWFSGNGRVVLMASSALTPQNISPGAVPFSGKWVVAVGWLVRATNNAFGTNSIAIDTLFPLDSSAGTPTLAGIALFEPMYDLNSAGTLTLIEWWPDDSASELRFCRSHRGSRAIDQRHPFLSGTRRKFSDFLSWRWCRIYHGAAIRHVADTSCTITTVPGPANIANQFRRRRGRPEFRQVYSSGQTVFYRLIQSAFCREVRPARLQRHQKPVRMVLKHSSLLCPKKGFQGAGILVSG